MEGILSWEQNSLHANRKSHLGITTDRSPKILDCSRSERAFSHFLFLLSDLLDPFDGLSWQILLQNRRGKPYIKKFNAFLPYSPRVLRGTLHYVCMNSSLIFMKKVF